MKKELYISICVGLVAIFSFALVSTAQAGTLGAVTISPDTLHGGRIGTYKISFSPASSVEVSSQVVVTFPSGFTIKSVMATTTLAAPSTTSTGVLASTSVDVSANSFILYLGGTGAITAAAETVQVTAGQIQSPYGGNSSVIVDVQTRTANGTAIDLASATAFAIRATLPTDAETVTSSSSYTAPPTSQITKPTAGLSIPAGESYIIEGTAQDQGISPVSKVEVSVDGAKTWLMATLTGNNWGYTWENPVEGSYTIWSRATDAAGNVEESSGEVMMTVGSATTTSAPVVDTTDTSVAGLQAQVAALQQQLVGLLQQLIAVLTAQL